MANEQAYTLFGLNNSDIGARVQDLQMGRVVNLSAFVRQLARDAPFGSIARRERHLLTQKNIEWITDHRTTYLDIYIASISDPNGRLLGTNLTFVDVKHNIWLKDEIERLNSVLAKVTQKLQVIQEV